MSERPCVISDGPLATAVTELLADQVELLDWDCIESRGAAAAGLYTYGHPTVNDQTLQHLPNLKVISNYGVGVDHIDVPAAAARGIPVGNTPGILNGATADMAMALVLASGRRLVEGDRYARSPAFTTYDPGYMLGREIHSTTMGIVGMGRIGEQVAQRARGFDMTVIYHNRRRKPEAEAALGVQYVSFADILAQSDYLVLCVPLTEETRDLIGAAELQQMKSTAILINVARGPVVNTDALTEALQADTIYAAGLDVTDPEPLPRGHALLTLENVIIAPHLGSATEQTRQKMAEISVINLLAGLRGEPLQHTVEP